jgi:prepilin peptidase CpaA
MAYSIATTAAAFLPVLLVWAAALDVLTRSIPNSISISLSVAFAIFAAAAGLSVEDIAAHVLCALLFLGCGFALFSAKLIGGGDVKLCAAAALWLGFGGAQPFLHSMAIAGGLLALVYLARHIIGAGFGLDASGARTIPYGVAIAAGALIVLPDQLATF